MESLESRQLLSVTLPALTDQTVLAGAPLNLALNGSSSASNPVAYTISVANSQLTNSQVANPQLTATVPAGNPSLRITVNSAANGIQGDMVLQLFEDLAPDTVFEITSLADDGFYDGLIFHRVIDGFMVQGGDPLGTGSGGPGFTFDDEFDPDLQFTSAGVLAMANSGNDTNGSQFFITTAPTRWLDFNHSIFGFLTQGSSVLAQIENVPTNSSDKPVNNVVMTSVSTFTDTQNGVLRLSTPDGTTGSAHVTVTARDTVTNETAVREFHVTVQADSTNDPPFIWGPIDPVYTTANEPVEFDIFGYDVEDDPIFYSGSATSGNGTLTVDSEFGFATYTPPSGATGVFKVQVNVGASSTTPVSALDTQTVEIHVTAANGGNTPPALTPASPSLGSTAPTEAKTILLSESFLNNGTGTTTVVDADDDVTISGIALVGLTGSGTWEYSLDDGITFDPVGTVTATSALLLSDLAQLRYTPNDVTGATAAITYRAWDMSDWAEGDKVNSTLGGSNSAFSTATDTANLTVTTVNNAPILTAANPSLGSTDENTAKTLDLTGSFLNNGAGTTTITDADPSAVVGGIAVVGVTGRGTWAYSTDGVNFTSMGTVSAGSALLVPKTAKIRYTPDNANGETATITYRAWDTSSGASGGRVDLSASGAVGGSAAFSAATDAASLTVASLNDAPVLTPASPSLGGTAIGTAKTISLATFLNNGAVTTSITDADTGATLGGIALVGVSGGGTWEYSTDGTTFSSADTVATTSALLLPGTAQLRYTPGAAGSETATITYRAWDTTTGTAGSKVDTSANGAETAFSTATDTASLGVGTSSLSGFVYIDNNNDGLRTVSGGSHLGLPGVVVKLLRKDDTSGNWTEVAGKSPLMTGADGSYRFEGLEPGTYRIQQVQPADYLDGKETVGQVGGQSYGTAGNDYFEMDSEGGENGTEYNFGERGLRPEKISLRLFLASTPPAAESILRTNAPPTVDLSKSLVGTGYSTTYPTGGSPVAIAAADAEIADADSSMLGSMRVTIGNRIDGDSEKLEADTTGTSLTSAYSGGVLTVTGVATPAVYRQVLSTVKYSDTAASPQGGNRSISVVVNDGIADSTAATATVNVVAPSVDETAPSGYTIAATDSLLNATEAAAAGFTFAGAEVGATYNYSITSSGGGTPVTGSGTISSATQQVTGINVSSLTDGTLTYNVTLRDAAGNTGAAATGTATLDKTAPAAYTIAANDTLLSATEATAARFTFTGAEVGATYNYSVTSSGGGTPATGSGTISSTTQEVTGINVSSLTDGALTYSVTLTDAAGNAGAAATATATLDKTAPAGYTISANDALLNATEAAAAGFTFAGAEVGATYNYTVTSSGGGAPVTGSGTVASATQQVTGINVFPLTDGTLTYNVTLTDTAGNAGTAATAAATLDKTAPTVAITPDGTTVNTSPVTFTVTFNEAVTGMDVGDLAAAGSASGALTLANFQAVSASVYTVDASGMASGESVTMTLAAAGAGIQDSAGNALAANAAAFVGFDDTAPTAAIAPDGTTVNTSPIPFTVTFDEPVTGVDLADLTATGSVSGALTLANFQAVSTTVYTVDVGGMASGENVTLTLTAAGSGIGDAAGNPLAANAAATAAYVDNVAPTAAITPDATGVNASPITFTVTFDEAVNGVDVGDLAATGSASGALTLANFQAVSATLYTVEVSGMTSGENVTLTLAAAGSDISDTAGNALAANAAANVAFDNIAPTAAVAPNGTSVNVSPITFTVTFDEAVTGVGIADLAATGSVSGALDLSSFQAVSATVYTVEVSGAATGENVTLTLTAAGSGIADTAANALAANAAATVTLDTTAPTAAITPNGTTVNTGPITFTVAFNEAVTEVDVADLAGTGSVSGALTLANFQAVSPTVYTVDVSGMASGENVTLTLAVAGSEIRDAASNALVAGAAGTVAFDAAAPAGYTIAADDSLINAGETASASFTFADAEVGTTYNYSVTSSGGTPVTGSGTVSSATQQVTGIDVSSLPDGTLTYSVTLTDTAGNVGPAATATAALDKTAPTAGVTPNGIAVNTSPISFTITFDEAVSGVDIADLTAIGWQSGPLTLANFQAVSATEYSVDVSGMAAGENVTLTLAAAGSGIADAAGNALAANAAGTVTFDTTAPAGYSIAVGDFLINASEAASTSFTFANAEVGATYDFTVTSSGGGTPVTESGTVSSATQQVTGIDVSSLPDGTLTYSVALRDAAGNAGAAATATATLDKTAPAGYTIAADDALLNATEATASGFTFAGAFIGATYNYTISSSGGGTPVTGSGTVSSATQQVTGINVSSLPDGTLTYSATLRDAADNVGAATTATATLDKTAPVATTTAVVNGDRIEFTVDFNEDVTGFDVDDVTATGSVTGALVVKDVNPNTPSSYRVRVEAMTTTAPGELVTLRSPTAGSFSDLAGNPAAVDAVFAQFNWVV